MNNSFIFTPPATAAGVERRASSVESQTMKHSRHSNAPAQPFSNVLDRAVQTPPKKVAEKAKHESLTGGRSAEHRSARSVEAHEEHRASAPQRSSRRKDKNEDDVAIQPAGTGMHAQVVLPIETAPLSEVGNEIIEGEIKIVNCSTAKTSTNEHAGESAAGGKSEATAAQGDDVNSQLLKLMPSGVDEVESNLVRDMKPAESALRAVASVGNTIPSAVAQTSATSLEGLLPEVAATTASPTGAMSPATQPIPAATAREVALGVSREEANAVSETGIPLVNPLDDSATSAAAVVNQIAPDELRRSVRLDRMIAAESPENTHGTAVAKMTMSMNNEAKREEIAGLTEQVLPGGVVSQPVTRINLPSEPQPRTLSGRGEIISVDALSAAARLTTGPTRADDSVNGNLLDVREASPAARLGEVISREVRMFKRGGDDMVEVVLTPDSKTQISLKLQWRDGQVEVQARCDLGDHRLLNTQWSQLQASFAAHGVRLSHLSERAHTGFTEFFGNAGFSQQRGGERQPAPQQSAIDVMKPVVPTAKTGAARSVIRSSNRLESWA